MSDPVKCKKCKGAKPRQKQPPCSTCKGSGWVTVTVKGEQTIITPANAPVQS